jgi:hypothetical protein
MCLSKPRWRAASWRGADHRFSTPRAAALRVSQKHHQPWITSPRKCSKERVHARRDMQHRAKRKRQLKLLSCRKTPPFYVGRIPFPMWCVQLAQRKSRFYVFVCQKINFGWVVKCYGVIGAKYASHCHLLRFFSCCWHCFGYGYIFM